jgi:hypothetical protein
MRKQNLPTKCKRETQLKKQKRQRNLPMKLLKEERQRIKNKISKKI